MKEGDIRATDQKKAVAPPADNSRKTYPRITLLHQVYMTMKLPM
jgi:hypothetical protein